MNVRTLSQFLDALAEPIRSVGGDPSLGGVRHALDPFAEMPVAEFASFLAAADEYRRKGTVAVLPPAVQRIGEAARGLSDDPSSRTPLEEALVAFGTANAMKVTAKTDAKLLAKSQSDRRIVAAEERVRSLAGRIQQATDYADPDHVQAFAEVKDALTAAEWKSLGAKLGATIGTKSDPVTAIISQLTGISPPASEKASKAKKGADPEAVRVHSVRLRDLSAQALDANRLSMSQIDVEMAEFEKLSEPTLKEVVKEAGLDLGGRGKKDVLNRIRRHLDVAHRAKAEVAV